MRSTVSYMLSHGSGEPIMSHPDYEQHAHHHGCLLVLLRGIGPLKPRSLQRIFERVQKVNNVKITDSAGQHRDVWIRYVHDHPVENNDWGDFQAHRRLLGLITIGKFESQTELNELCRLHESLKVKYTSTLFDSRCILFGPPQKIEINNSKENESRNNVEDYSSHPSPKLEDNFSTPTNFKSTAFFYNEGDPCRDLEPNLSDFISSIFWILESKRLERSREKIDKVPLLLAPFEKKDFVGLDLDSRNNRKRCIGRVTKNLGDLTLQAGLVSESLNYYHSASETLRAISDSLWLGAAEEGLCAASAILMYPGIRQTEIFHRNASLQEGISPQRNLEKRRSTDLTRKVILENQISGEGTATSNSSSSTSVSSLLTSSSSSSISGVGINGRNDLPLNILTSEEIVVHYRKAIINYSKYRHAAIVETEAALKAARICIEQNKNLDVAMFLQNVLYINLNMTEQERVKRFEVMTDLYQQIGYRRKAAFCQRLAAWKHVKLGNPNPDWAQSYRLMLESFPGYLLSLDPLEVLENSSGWPMLQIDLLQQLITAARRLGHSALATRHMTFLLQTQWDHMGAAEQKEMALQLQNLSAQCEGSPVPLVLENGTVIPPANLTDIPYCIQFQVKDSPAHLKPHRINIVKGNHGPFLFTPIHFNSIDRRVTKKKESKVGFFWVQHDLCEVTLKFKNILPFELTLCDMRLLTNGIVFESLPQTIVLQPSVSTVVTLHGTPIESGQLEIQGYSTHTLGVKSNCRLKHMKNRTFPPNYLVDVIPAMPRLSAQTSLPQTATFSSLANSDSVITSASLTIYNGETAECIVTITNESNVPVEHLETIIHSNVEGELQGRIFKIDQKEIESKLPIASNCSIDFAIQIFGEADFLGTQSQIVLASSSSQSGGGGVTGLNDGPHSLNYSTMSSGHASLPSRMSSPTHQAMSRRTDLTSSFRSSHSGGHSSIATLSFPPQSGGNTVQHLEAQLRLKYSGGEAMEEGYCRQCAISFNLELLPSAQITNWDVLPAETPSQFYLVLDISNLTGQEMTLNYTPTKSILIEAKESCRVPIPVDRCSLEKLYQDSITEGGDSNEHRSTFSNLPSTDISEKVCSEHIAERVKLNWTLNATETKGTASLKGITLSPTMIDLITIAPLQWAVTLNSALVQPQSEIVCLTGQCVALSITVCNLSHSPLRQLILTIQFYQDYQNGVHNYHLETRVSMSGPNQTLIPVLKRNEKVHHECTVVFFTPGRFKANIQCRSLSSSSSGISSSSQTNTLTSSCPVPVNYQMLHSFALASNNASFHEAQHVWRFIPPVEVTVVE